MQHANHIFSDDTQQVTSWGSRVQSFLLRNGTYDWNRDHAGVKFLKFASQYDVPYITFFINAAPSNISSNGASCGWNFTANKDEPFAKYIETVLTHWTEQGIDISYISPMNEPDNSRANCGQEGMMVVPGLRAGVFEAIRAALNGSPADHVGIIGDETSRPYLQGIPENPVGLSLRFDAPAANTIRYGSPIPSPLSLLWPFTITTTSRMLSLRITTNKSSA